ncbi:MAG: hypothetical protein SEPTF4163_005382 [Sporothrix epigloea]
MGSHSTPTDLPDIGRLRIEETSPAHGAAQFKTPAVPPALTPLGERQQMAVRNQAVTEQQGRTQDARFLAPDAAHAMLHPAIPAPSSDGERQRMAVSSQDATVRQRSADRQGRAGFGQEQGHYAGQRQGTRGHDAPWDRPAGHEEVRPGYYGDNGGTGGQNASFGGYGGPPQSQPTYDGPHQGFQGQYGGGGFQGQFGGGGFQGHQGGGGFQGPYGSDGFQGHNDGRGGFHGQYDGGGGYWGQYHHSGGPYNERQSRYERDDPPVMVSLVLPSLSQQGEKQQMAVSNQAMIEQQGCTGVGQEQGHGAPQNRSACPAEAKPGHRINGDGDTREAATAQTRSPKPPIPAVLFKCKFRLDRSNLRPLLPQSP